MAEESKPKTEVKQEKTKKEEKKQKPKVVQTSWKWIQYPQLAEKSMNMVETENKLVFIVNRKATKQEIKNEVESSFGVRVLKINVEITRKGQKKAYLKLHPDDSAADIASRMGML